MIDKATRLLPYAEWWIKADGVDVVPGLSESVKLEWSGDVDLNDRVVEKMHAMYMKRLKFIEHAGVSRDLIVVCHDLQQLQKNLCDDLEFVHQGNVYMYNTVKYRHYNIALKVAQAKYTEKFDSGKSTRQTLFALGWKVDELDHLMKECRSLRVEIQVSYNIY